MPDTLTLSIIITSYTTERINDIYELLDSIIIQKYPDMEVIFVAERSQELKESIIEYGKKKNMTGLKVLFNYGEPGLSAGRNVGIHEATGDIIAFLDDDVVLFPEWLAEIMKAFEDNMVIGATGPALPLWEDDSMAWLPEEFYWLISCTAWNKLEHSDCPVEVRNAWGMNMAFRKEAFEKCGLFSNDFGYHKGLYAEDNEISLRFKQKTGGKIVCMPKAKVWHRVHKYRFTWRFIRDRALWIGRSRKALCKEARKNGNTYKLKGEKALLGRIFKSLIPGIIKQFFTRPVIAWHKMRVTVLVLYFVGWGYLTPSN